jgi:hypothetical protein
MRTLKFITVTYFVAALCFTFYAFTNFPVEKMANLIFDDAYYYLGVAQNIAEGKGSTFGNIVETNGYHPLWLLILSAIIYVFSLEKIWAFAAVPLLVLLIKIFALLRVDPKESAEATSLFVAMVLIILLCPSIFSNGLETCLLLLCLPLLSQIKDYPEHFSVKTSLKYSAIFFVLFLVRLDVLAVAGAFSILTVVNRKKYAVSNLAVTLGFTALGVLVYFAINFALFGTIVPVSGQAKAIGNKLGENLPILLNYLLSARLAVGAFVLSVILKYMLFRNTLARMPFANELKLTTLTAIIVGIYYGVFSGWPLWGWYYWPTALVTLYALAQLVYLAFLARKHVTQGLKPLFLNVAAWGFVAYVLLLGIRTEIATDSNIFYSSLKKDANPNFTIMNMRLVNEFFATAPDGIVAMGDRAGGLGFWLPERFKFFHTEGLVANKEYVSARKSGTGLDFLKSIGIKYFVVERERLMEGKLADGTPVHGIVEPIQGLSIHSGLVMICLPVNSILYTQNYEKQIRHVYDFTKVTDCPQEIHDKVDALSKNYGELRRYSLPTEYEVKWTLMKYIKSNPF